MRRSTFSFVLLLVAVFLIPKFVLGWHVVRETRDWSIFIAATAEDVLVALALGLLGGAALRLTARRPALHRTAWFTICVLGTLFAVYSIAHIGIFKCLGLPLTARMFDMVGRAAHLRSSIAAQCTPGLLGGIAAALLISLLVSFGRLKIPAGPKVKIALVLLAIGWATSGLILRAQAEPDAWARIAGGNPHWTLVRSFAKRLFQDRRITLDAPYPPGYLDDFRPSARFRRPALDFVKSPPRNVIVVVLESVGAQYASLCGSRVDTTPRLLAESANAIVFDRFHANAGYTSRSAVPIFFSAYPGVPWCIRPAPAAKPMPVGLPRLLKPRGVRTAFLSAAHADWDGMEWYATTSGLEEFRGPDQLGGPAASSWGTEDGVVIDGLIKWIDADRAKPFYAVVWTDQTHHPYTLDAGTKPVQFVDPQTRRFGEELNRYLNAIRQVDRHLGRLFDALRARNLADDTLVVITGDHGEGFGEPHDTVKHGSTLFNESQHVPMMIWNPRLFPTGIRSQQVGSHVDLNPTIAHILDVEIPSDWQGASLFSPDHPGRAYFIADLAGYQFGVTDGRHKFILYASDGFERLYDLQTDPLELKDLSKHYPDLVTEMRGRISAFVNAEEAYLGIGGPKR